MLKTPILFIIFNRPETTTRVFESIREVKPEQLFVAADGPRTHRLGEVELCEATRDIIKKIDWPCKVHTKFQDENLGCKLGPITAIDWFFKSVESGIILEDDCLPNQSFFNFCSKLLEYYEDEHRIMHISGNNFQFGALRGNASYYFSKYSHSWGWATWRRAWNMFHPALDHFSDFENKKLIEKINISKKARKFWMRNFRIAMNGNDSWDSLWMYAVWRNDALAIIPQKNLVSNIGFGKDATHTTESGPQANIATTTIGNMIYLDDIRQDTDADEFTFKMLFKISLARKIQIRFKKIIRSWIK